MSQTQLRAMRSDRPRARLTIQLSMTASCQLEQLKEFYERHLGRNVSVSIIVRRAVDSHLAFINTLAGKERIREEVSALIRQTV